MFGVPSIVPCLVFPPLYHVWCSLHCTMFGVPSIVPCLVFPPLYHVWCSLHCTMFGVPSIVPCLVFPPLYHVWCSLHCTMFGVPSIVPCLVFPPLYHVWCSLHCRGGSRISEKGGLLINIHEWWRGSGAEPQPPTPFYYIMRTTLHNTALRLFARRAAVVLRISAIFTSQ